MRIYSLEKNMLLNEMTSQHEEEEKKYARINMCKFDRICMQKYIILYCVGFNSILYQSNTKGGE